MVAELLGGVEGAELAMDELDGRSSRARFSWAFIHRLTPDGWGSGTATASSCSKRSPIAASRLVTPSSLRIASPPTGTINRGWSSRSSHSRQNEQSSCSRAVGVRSPPPPGARPG